jgi:hypothetical protein
LAPVIADRLRICVIKKGKPAGSMPSSSHLNTMLAAETFLQQFLPLDTVVTVPMYLPGFVLTRPGYNNGGPRQRIFYVGPAPTCEPSMDAVTRFLDVMAFAGDADRTNAVGAGLTVMLRNQWPGAKPLLAVTSTKSHGGKDTVIDFAAGRTPHASVSYERQDWALQKNFACNCSITGRAAVGNADERRPTGDRQPSGACDRGAIPATGGRVRRSAAE